jgi:uncharacterized protein (TIGR02996 family)
VQLIEHILDQQEDALDCPEGQAFLAAIRENPDEPTGYLVLADWLEEHDDPARAEFIRLQCERASLPPPTNWSEQPCQRREQELLRLHGARWCRPLPVEEIEFRFGMPATLRLQPQHWQHAAEVLAWHPTIYQLRLVAPDHAEGDVAECLRQLLRCPDLERLRTLFLNRVAGSVPGLSGFGEYDLPDCLARCPHLANLTTLELSFNQITEMGAMLLSLSPYLGRLVRLGLASNVIGPAGLRALLMSPHLTRLEELDVRGELVESEFSNPGMLANIGDGVRWLATTEAAARLRRLNIAMNNVNVESARLLAKSPHLDRLEGLVAWEVHDQAKAVQQILRDRFGDQLLWHPGPLDPTDGDEYGFGMPSEDDIPF